MGIAVGNGCTGTEIGVCGGERDKYDAEYLIRAAQDASAPRLGANRLARFVDECMGEGRVLSLCQQRVGGLSP